jgi:hypothetical protein
MSGTDRSAALKQLTDLELFKTISASTISNRLFALARLV